MKRVFNFLEVFKSHLNPPVLLRFFGTFFNQGAYEYSGCYTYYNWRNAVNKGGLYPIHLRVYIHPLPCKYYPVRLPQKGKSVNFYAIYLNKKEEKGRSALEIEEVQALRKLEFEKIDKSLEQDRDLFLFQVYTGFYYNDLQILKKTQFFRDVQHGYYIISERDKNNNSTIIPLFKFPYATAIIEKYRDDNSEDDFLFRRNVFVEVQVYNRNLKVLASRANVNRPISDKTGRHTNAQMWVRFGAERPVLSKMLGHEKEQMTENYYKVGLREIIEGTRSANFEQYGF